MTFSASLPDLVQQFAPFVFFHSAEENLPCSADWYLRQVGYVHVAANKTQQTYNPGDPGWTPLTAFPYPGEDVADYLFIPGDDSTSWHPPAPAAATRAGNLASATAYVHVVPVTKDSHGNPVEWLDLQYWLFYAFNGAESVVATEGGIHESSRINLSFHEADWEHVVVRIDASSNIIGVFFAQHDYGEWSWQPATADPANGYSLTNGSQVEVYAGLGSHASYPRAGGPYWIESKGFAGITLGIADWTSPFQQRVDYAEAGRTVIVRNDATQWFSYTPPTLPWMGFAGHWGLPRGIPLTVADVAADIVGVVADWPLVRTIEDLISPLAAAILPNLLTWSTEGPANLPYQPGWNSQFTVSAAAYGNGTWTGFPEPAIGSLSSLACATDGALVHAAYVGADGFVRYLQYDGARWSGEGVVIGGQTATNSPAVAVLNGSVFCVFQNNAELYWAQAGPPYSFGDAVKMNNPGISDNTSPALLVQDGTLYCLYQDYHSPGVGNGTLRCLAYQPAQQQWVAQTPPAADFPGMSYSPAAALLGDTAYVLYQGYDNSQQLSGTTRTGSSWQRLRPDNLPVAGAPSPYLSLAPSAAAAAGTLYAAFFGAGSSQLRIARLAGGSWALETALATNASAGTSPTLIAYGDQLVVFYLTMS